MSKADNTMIIRDGTPADQNFILSSWLQSHQASSAWARPLRPKTYTKHHSALLAEILARPNVRVRIACTSRDPYIILGWAVTEGEDILHYVYTKELLRRKGIARALVSEIPAFPNITYSHRTIGVEAVVERLIRTHLPDATFNPYLAWPVQDPAEGSPNE